MGCNSRQPHWSFVDDDMTDTLGFGLKAFATFSPGSNVGVGDESTHQQAKYSRTEEWMTTITNKHAESAQAFHYLSHRYEDCPGGWKTLLALVWASETRPLTGPKRVLVPRTRAGHGSGFGLFPRSAAYVFFLLFSLLNLVFWYIQSFARTGKHR